MPDKDIMTHRDFSAKATTRHGEIFEPNTPDEERAYKNAAEVLTMIRDGTLKPSELKAQDRRPVVAYLRLEGYSKEEMSRLFEIDVRTVAADLATISKDRTKVIKGLNLLEVAGRMYQTARHLSRKARREGSYSTSWKIEKELVEALQSMGFVYRAPKTLGIASLHGSLQEGHSALKDQIGTEKDMVVDALGSILSAMSGKNDRKVRISNEPEKEQHRNRQQSDEHIEVSDS